MRTAFTAIGLWLAGSSVALACVCAGPFTPQERRDAAARIAKDASAVAEIELVEPLDYEKMRPELYRVVKVHAGKAPAQFRLDRDFQRAPTGEVHMGMTSCDTVPPAGQRTLVVLYGSKAGGRYRIGGTCDHMFVNSPGAIDLIRAAASNPASQSERG